MNTQLELEQSETSPIIHVTDKWRIREINNRQDAIRFGKNRGWCTADKNNDVYDHTYNKDIGDLYILYQSHKKRPHAQLFITKAFRSFEIRLSNNRFYVRKV